MTNSRIKFLTRTITPALIVAVVAAVMLATPGCSKKKADTRPVCYVGGTMYPVMQELAKLYEKKTGQEIRLDKAGSGVLMERIEAQEGTESDDNADLYICHDPYLDKLFARGLGAEGWTIAAITPVIVVQPGNPKGIKTMKDLATTKDLRIVLTDFKHSTLGWMLPTLFAKVGVDFEKEIKPLKSLETHRRGGESANKVMSDTRDVTVVWNAVAHLRKPKVEVIELLPEHLPQPDVKEDMVTSASEKKDYDISTIRVTLSTIKGSKRAEASKKFAEFVVSEEAQKIWKDFGFTQVPVTKEY